MCGRRGRYIEKPFLIDGRKFDLRLYVAVTSYDPLRIYLYDDAMARFATVKYKEGKRGLSNAYVALPMCHSLHP